MPAKLDLINKQFGNLLVLQETESRKNNSVVWKCKCLLCNNDCFFSTKELRSDGLIQCHDCSNKRNPQTNLTENIIGKKYNHLTVISKTSKRSDGKIIFKCECDCPEKTIVYVTRTDLLNGHTKSCGCISRKYQIGDIINNRKILGHSDYKIQGRHNYTCQCLLCSRIYNCTTQTLDKTYSCGCQKSIGEAKIIDLLKTNNIKYIKEYCFPNSLLRFDFALLDDNNQITRLIEFDGEQHFEDKKNWGIPLQIQQQRDKEKNQYALSHNIPLVRIPYWERDKITLEMIMGDQYLVKD